ncbi:MAG: outer membrane beta-barrel protein [Pseudomonadota bacterium]
MKTVLAAALVVAAGAAQAGGPVVVADDPAVVAAAAPAAAGYDWTGFYVGVSAISGTFSDNGGATSGGTNGYGLQAGYLRDFGTWVLGGELAFAKGDYDAFPLNDWTSTRLKLIGGYGAGRVLPYGFVGLSNYDVRGASQFSDTVTIYGLGAKVAVFPRIAVGLEYLVENKTNFGNSGFDMENSELALRLDYRF